MSIAATLVECRLLELPVGQSFGQSFRVSSLDHRFKANGPRSYHYIFWEDSCCLSGLAPATGSTHRSSQVPRPPVD